jgi:glutathione synthase/RimK-type ligase-like ATP-grasp enzyme
MSAAIAIASCAPFAGAEPEDLKVIAALRARGIESAHAAWDDDGVDWSSFALVVVRSTWDYPSRLHEFLAWASRLRRVLNPLAILKWNTDKRYLNDLAAAGVPVVPTQFLKPGDAFDPPGKSFVVKPAVSCGARDTAMYRFDQVKGARAHVRRLQEGGRIVMVQPYLERIEQAGEISLMFTGGAYSHAVFRGALLNAPGSAAERAVDFSLIRRLEPTREQLRIAGQALAAVPGGSGNLLFARVDLIPGPDGSPLVLEVELTEPYLFLGFSKHGVNLLADAIAQAIAL